MAKFPLKISKIPIEEGQGIATWLWAGYGSAGIEILQLYHFDRCLSYLEGVTVPDQKFLF